MEEMLLGAKQISKFLNWSERKFYYWKEEMIYSKLLFQKRKPNKYRGWMWAAWPSVLIDWTRKKGAMGERI